MHTHISDTMFASTYRFPSEHAMASRFHFNVPEALADRAHDEGVARLHRRTRGGRSLWYQMTVLQQPERARACGSGSKGLLLAGSVVYLNKKLTVFAANSDRRPVDPPPVVELRIIEGQTVETGRDVTFDYNANFFLYASLEQARPMAHGRVNTPAAINPPILTGVPVSGMAYLDRPAEAGYFIFPDLSVRHEGYYRLSFSLYETCKDESDADASTEMPDPGASLGVDWRMEIKTRAFNVFSAKKFPGLMESTQLSKTVADQGCRVRIRRDVRMRKRDAKGGSGTPRESRDGEAGRSAAATPAPEDHASAHGRSPSVVSERRASTATQQVPETRRPSADPYASATPLPPPSAPSAPIPPARPTTAAPSPVLSPHSTSEHVPGYSSRHHLSFGECSSVYGRRPMTLPALPSTYHSQSLYSRSEPTTTPHDSHRYPSAPRSPSIVSLTSNHSRRASQLSYGGTPSTRTPLPLETSTSALENTTLAPLKISSLMSPLPPIEAQTEPLPPPPAMYAGDKRRHDYVFSSHGSDSRVTNGARQPEVDYRYGQAHYESMFMQSDGYQMSAQFNQWRQ